jgi:hypothetical protein
MATSLTGQNVNTTYDSLIKVGDNGPITSTPKQLSDGLGNEFPMKASLTEVQITGSLFGTSSWARNAVSSSYILNAVSASFATSASYARTASFAVDATNAQFANSALETNALEWQPTTSNVNFPLSLVNTAGTYSEHNVDTDITFNPSTNVLTLTGSLRVSGSITGSILGTASFATNALSASHALTASYTPNAIVTSSNEFAELTFTKGNGSQFTIDASPNYVRELVKNKETTTLAKGTPVYVSGSTGNASNVYKADAGIAAKMPAAYVLNESLAADAEGFALLSGFINGVDTSAFQAGEAVYVAVGGGYTNVKPTGSALIQKLGNVIKVDANGSGVITGAGRSNDIPNIAAGNVWVGNSDGVPTAVSSASLLVNTASFATTASYARSASVATSATLATLAASATSATTAEKLDLTSTTSNVNYRLVLATGTGTGQILYADSEPASIAWNASTNRLNISGAISASAITSSLLGTASFATTASHALNGGVTQIIAGTNVTISPVGGTGAVTINSSGGGGSTDTGSLLRTASVNLNTITFTKGDGSTFPITVNTGSGGGVTINNNTDNYIVTATGTANTLNGESGLTYNGSTLTVSGTLEATKIRISRVSTQGIGNYGINAEIADTFWTDSTASLSSGSVVYWKYDVDSGSLWRNALADTGSGIYKLGVVTKAESQDDVLVRGIVNVTTNIDALGGKAGDIVYLSPTSAGNVTLTIPTGSGEVVRILGYVYNPTARTIVFEPTSTWVEL